METAGSILVVLGLFAGLVAVGCVIWALITLVRRQRSTDKKPAIVFVAALVIGLILVLGGASLIPGSDEQQGQMTGPVTSAPAPGAPPAAPPGGPGATATQAARTQTVQFIQQVSRARYKIADTYNASDIGINLRSADPTKLSNALAAYINLYDTFVEEITAIAPVSGVPETGQMKNSLVGFYTSWRQALQELRAAV